MKIKVFAFIILALAVSSVWASAQDEKSSERWLTIEVTGESGQPLKHACVTLVPREGEIVFRKANNRGVVKLKRPLAGNYRVVVKVDGYEAQKREVTIGANSETVAFSLQPRLNPR